MSAATKIRIFDTTLRDGEQSPGFTMNGEEKMMMAQQLARLGVNTIEAGFAGNLGRGANRAREGQARRVVLRLGRAVISRDNGAVQETGRREHR